MFLTGDQSTIYFKLYHKYGAMKSGKPLTMCGKIFSKKSVPFSCSDRYIGNKQKKYLKEMIPYEMPVLQY